ncbi:MAG: response regulator [Bdellovibrionales bacterium]|nr:response regulator [Bdellovibrionales bacterium]
MNSVAGDHPSILVVDDNPLITNVLRSLFRSEGYDVHVSKNGAEALQVLEGQPVDLVICDVMMPTMDGYELHEQIRKKPELSHVPFVFLTALGDNVEVSHGREIGADDYVVKPFDPRQLLSLVKGKIVRSNGLKDLVEERYDKYRKRVVHTLSHEFRTPLVAINTGTELLLDQQGELDLNRVKNVLEAIKRGGQRLERLVGDFMLIQQIEAGVAQRLFESRRALRKVSDLLRDFVDSRLEMLRAEGFELKVFDNSGDARVEIYEAQIFDALDRLISNAVKFKLRDFTIEMHAYCLEGEAVIEVRDRGIGLDVDRVKEAIDVFGQLDRDKLEQQGGGMGLAIASRYAALHGGRLEFERREGGGSVVTLYLPLAASSHT